MSIFILTVSDYFKNRFLTNSCSQNSVHNFTTTSLEIAIPISCRKFVFKILHDLENSQALDFKVLTLRSFNYPTHSQTKLF